MRSQVTTASAAPVRAALATGRAWRFAVRQEARRWALAEARAAAAREAEQEEEEAVSHSVYFDNHYRSACGPAYCRY